MSNFLHLHDWLNASQALSYLKISGIDVSVPDLVKAYKACEFEMKLDFKDPATYVLKLEGAQSYPNSLFNVNAIDQNLLQHEDGELIRMLLPERVSSCNLQRGYGKDEAVWIYSWMQDDSFKSSRNVPVYLKWDGHRSPEYRRDFEMLKWGALFSEFPNLLLFKRENLDSLIQSEKHTITKFQNGAQADEKASLGSKERNTLLVLIAALCREAKIDYNQRGVSTAIQKMTEEIGAPVTDDTINRVLKQIEAALERRSK